MNGITMAKRTYWEFFNPKELALIVHVHRGTVSEAEMHVKTTTDADVNIDLLGPKLTSDIHSDLTELSRDLTKVAQVQCWREPLADGTLRSRIEITRENGERESIRCDEIKGLPA
jgi:hypothetical protein